MRTAGPLPGMRFSLLPTFPPEVLQIQSNTISSGSSPRAPPPLLHPTKPPGPKTSHSGPEASDPRHWGSEEGRAGQRSCPRRQSHPAVGQGGESPSHPTGSQGADRPRPPTSRATQGAASPGSAVSVAGRLRPPCLSALLTSGGQADPSRPRTLGPGAAGARDDPRAGPAAWACPPGTTLRLPRRACPG